MMASKPSLTATPEKSTAEWAGVIKAIASAIASPCFISDPPLPEQMAGRARSTSVPVDVWAKQEQNQSQACWRGAMLSFVVNRSEEHTSELQSLMRISYAVFCLQK